MTGALVAGLLAGYGIALPVGAVGAYVVALTARTSLRVGAAAALGVATADGLYALVAALGGVALVGLIQPIAVQLTWISAAVLSAVALHMAVRAIHRFRTDVRTGLHPSTPPSAIRAYAGLVMITIVNPLTIVYFAALAVGSRAGVAVSAAEQVVFVAAAFVASASWQLVLVCGGTLLGRFLTGPRGRLSTALASSVLITALAVQQL